MAGIGFVLDKLLKKGTISSTVTAFLHSSFASSGPWMITVLSLAFVYYYLDQRIHYTELDLFRSVILYNFAFSLIISAPINVLSTRVLSDYIYRKDLNPASGLLIGSLISVYILALPVPCIIYFMIGTFTKRMAILAILNFMLVTTLWQTSIFLSTLKRFSSVSLSFFFGMLVMIISMQLFSSVYKAEGVLISFSLGLCFIIGPIISLVMAQYPKMFKKPFYFLQRFTSYWKLTIGAFFGALGIWIDKFVMWTSPQALVTPENLIMYPQYDSASFMAFLVVIPSIALFFLSHETSFYKEYIRYYDGIRGHDKLQRISENRDRIIRCYLQNSKTMLVFQGIISLVAIITAPLFLKALKMNYVQLSMFRLITLGATFQIFAQQLTIQLGYFDAKNRMLGVQFLFLVTNGLFTYISLFFGFPYYGMGFFLSSLLMFIVAAIALENFLQKLTYHSFITVNQSILDQ